MPGKTLVIVESDDELRGFLDSLLGAAYQILPFATGKSALRGLDVMQPDMLLVDLELSDMHGEDVAKSALLLRPAARVVAMSENPARLQLARPLVDATIRKPFSITELTTVLQSTLNDGAR